MSLAQTSLGTRDEWNPRKLSFPKVTGTQYSFQKLDFQFCIDASLAM